MTDDQLVKALNIASEYDPDAKILGDPPKIWLLAMAVIELKSRIDVVHEAVMIMRDDLRRQMDSTSR